MRHEQDRQGSVRRGTGHGGGNAVESDRQRRWEHAPALASCAIAARVIVRRIRRLRRIAGSDAMLVRSVIRVRVCKHSIRSVPFMYVMRTRSMACMRHPRHRPRRRDPVQDQRQSEQQIEDRADHRTLRLHRMRKSFNQGCRRPPVCPEEATVAAIAHRRDEQPLHDRTLWEILWFW